MVRKLLFYWKRCSAEMEVIVPLFNVKMRAEWNNLLRVQRQNYGWKSPQCSFHKSTAPKKSAISKFFGALEKILKSKWWKALKKESLTKKRLFPAKNTNFHNVERCALHPVNERLRKRCFCKNEFFPLWYRSWRVPSHAVPRNLVRSGTKQPYWCTVVPRIRLAIFAKSVYAFP